MAIIWGSNFTVVQTSTRLTVEYPFFTRNDMQPPLKFAYALDGSETRNSVMMGRGAQQQVSKAAWDGDALVITGVIVNGDPIGCDRDSCPSVHTRWVVGPDVVPPQ